MVYGDVCLMKKNIKMLGEIYNTFLKLGFTGFGGGFSIIPLVEREVVEEKKWVDKEKMIDIFAISSSLPGATALNASAFAGYAVCGIPGAIAALLGNMTPSVIIVLVLSVVYSQISTYSVVKSAFRGIYPVIVGLISYAAYKIGKTAIADVVGILLAIATLVCAIFFSTDPIPLIIAGAVIGILITIIRQLLNKRNFPSNKNGDL